MGAELKAELNIPDLWFDFYARFLPGTTFVIIVRFFLLGYKNIPAFEEILGLVFMGYISALITQPLSSRLVIVFESAFGTCEKRPKDQSRSQFIKYVQKQLGEEKRMSLVISKMKAEINFFIQMSSLSLIYLILQIYFGTQNCTSISINLIVFIVALINAIEVTFRRYRKVCIQFKLMNPVLPDKD